MDAIKTEGLTKRFGALTAVDGLTFSVAQKEVFGLVGPDGAGKTTTLRMLASIMDPTSGQAWVAGEHTVRAAANVKRHIGYMSQRFGLYADLTVSENIAFYADLYGVTGRERSQRLSRLMEFSGLGPFGRRLAGNLSGGMKQKLGLICTLIHRPAVLLLDEPTNGVDPVSRRDFWRVLYQLPREGVTVVISTAYLDEAERAERLCLLHKGKILAMGTPDQVKGLMRGSVVEVRVPEARRATGVLRDAMPGLSVGMFGDRIHVAGGEAGEMTDRALEALRSAGAGEAQTRQVEPSLEDVFVSTLADAPSGGPHGQAAHLPVSEPGPAVAVPAGPAVSVRGLRKQFGDFVAVNRVNFDVSGGEVFGFLGPNGAGKSTTIRMLCGILSPGGGSGTVAGADIATQSELVKTRIGYMSQRFSLYEDLTVDENIDFYSGIYRLSRQRRRDRKEWVLEMAALRDHRRTPAGALAGGWKQRLALGCAILHEPPVLFLDEPTSGVDPISRRRFWDLIYRMAGGGVTVFVTTHYMDEAEYCDRVALMYKGELIAIDSPAALKAKAMTDDVLEVPTDSPMEAMAAIEGVEGVLESALFGRGLHVVARRSPAGAEGDVADRVRRRLAERFGSPAVVRKVAPSLEDVFVSLIEEHDRRAGQTPEACP